MNARIIKLIARMKMQQISQKLTRLKGWDLRFGRISSSFERISSISICVGSTILPPAIADIKQERPVILIGRMEGNLFQLVDSDGGVFLNEDLPDILPEGDR